MRPSTKGALNQTRSCEWNLQQNAYGKQVWESLFAASSKPHAYGIGGIGKKMRTKTPNGPVLKATILAAMAARIADLPSNS